MNLRNLLFSHIMIDEAGQASEARMWIPIGTLATSETSVILCGDPKQLGPVTKLDIPKRLQDTFISPLFRYMDIYEYKHDK
jgi:superfamily I DNA and/or RNA helicase